ncbi:MAG TPA: uridine kinase [Cryomorphaceae bacterium]|nr:uridine kinase [Cryomorphaceae bacterium]
MEYKSPYVVGVAGGSASGKTSILNDLMNHFEASQVALISQDNYYYERERQFQDVNGEINFDLPTAIDRESLNQDVADLIEGKIVVKKEYTFNNPAAETKMVSIQPAPILIIEGLFVFHYVELAAKMDLKVYVDALEDVKLKRRIIRDLTERGYPESDVRYRWKNHVMPSYHNYLKPHKKNCDIIINNNSTYQNGLTVLVNHLKASID